MRLLVDTDAFCKLALADLLPNGIALFGGVGVNECGRLPALPYMLRRGRLPRTYGEDACRRLVQVAERMPRVERPSGRWIDALTPIAAIDPGEAILFAVAAERELPVVTGDVRALRALKDVPGFSEALEGRVATLEAILLGLCGRIGSEVVRSRVEALRPVDAMIRICFSAENASPEAGLRSYLEGRRRETVPLVLWHPSDEGAEGGDR